MWKLAERAQGWSRIISIIAAVWKYHTILTNLCFESRKRKKILDMKKQPQKYFFWKRTTSGSRFSNNFSLLWPKSRQVGKSLMCTICFTHTMAKSHHFNWTSCWQGRNSQLEVDSVNVLIERKPAPAAWWHHLKPVGVHRWHQVHLPNKESDTVVMEVVNGSFDISASVRGSAS